MAALDADVIKAYVELGIGIIAAHAFNAERDTDLKLLDARSLLAANTSRIAVRRGAYLRGYAYRFISRCSPSSRRRGCATTPAPTGTRPDRHETA